MRKLFFLCLLLCAVCAQGESAVSEERDGDMGVLPGVWCIFRSPTWTPLQMALFHTKLFGRETAVYGLNVNLNLVSSQRNVFGITAGTINIIDNHYGLLVGIVNAYERSGGVAVAGLWNIGEKKADVGIAPFNMSNDDILQIGGVNMPFLIEERPKVTPAFQMGIVNGTLDSILQTGLFNTAFKSSFQLGFLNHKANHKGYDTFGTQFGCFNICLREEGSVKEKEWSGCLQIGIFNCETLHGVQIGLLNYNPEALLPWMPLFNFSFAPSSEPDQSADDPENGL